MKLFFTLCTSLLTLSISAQVGIGTTSPSEALDIESSDGTKTSIDINNTGAGDPLIHFQLSGTSLFTIGVDDTDSDKFKIGTTALETSTAITINASQQVAIGHANPSATLDVDGDAIFNESGASKDFRIEGLTETNLFFVDVSADFIGVANASPTATLDVDGSAIFNESNAAVDFRVEGGTEANLLFIDGSADKIGIGTATPANTLDIEGDMILQNGTSINEFSIDGTFAGNSDDAVPTEQAVKEYVDGLVPSLDKTITIEAPTATDYFPLFRTDIAITIVEAIGMLNAAGDVDVRLYWDTDFAETSPTVIGATTTLTTTSEVSVSIATDATIPANSWIFIDIPEATSAQTVSVDIRYTED